MKYLEKRPLTKEEVNLERKRMNRWFWGVVICASMLFSAITKEPFIKVKVVKRGN